MLTIPSGMTLFLLSSSWALCTKHCCHFPDYALLMIKYLGSYSSYGQKEYLKSSTLNTAPCPAKQNNPPKYQTPLTSRSLAIFVIILKKQNKQETSAVPIRLFIWQLRKAFF